MKKILITGIAGAIGSHLYRDIQTRHPDWFIYGVDNFSIGDWENLKDFRGSLLYLDMADVVGVVEALGFIGFDGIVHLASNTHTYDTNYDKQLGSNLAGFRSAIALAGHNKCPLFVASSASVYGKVDHASKESDPFSPDTQYAFSKMMIETELGLVKGDNALCVRVGRFFNVYSCYEEFKAQSQSMVWQLIHQVVKRKVRLFKHGEQQRDFIYAGDVSSFIIDFLENPTPGTYNVGTGVATSFLSLVNLIAQRFNKMLMPYELVYIDNPHNHYQNFTCADLTKVHEELTWRPTTSIQDGIDILIKHLGL